MQLKASINQTLNSLPVRRTIQILGCFLGFFVFTKLSKNLNHLISKSLSHSDLSLFYHNISFFDVLLVALFALLLLSKDTVLTEWFNQSSCRFLMGFLVLTRISLFFIPSTHTKVAYPLFLNLVCSSSLFFFFSSAFFSRCFKQAIAILTSLFFSFSLFECFVGIAQYFHRGSLGWRFLGEGRYTGAGISSHNGFRWIFDYFSDPSSLSHELYRSYGTFPHPNVFGGFLAASLIAHFCFYFSPKKYPFKFVKPWMIEASIFIHLFTLFTTFSRSAGLAWSIATCLLFLLLWKRRKELPYFRLFIVIASCLVVNFLLLNTVMFQRVQELSVSGISEGKFNSRINFALIALRMVAAHPLFGVGYKQYINEMFLFGADASTELLPVHNIYLLIASEVGLPAIMLFLLFIGSITKEFFKLEKDLLNYSFFLIFISFLIIGIFDCYPITVNAGRVLFFSIAGLSVCRFKSSQNLEEVHFTSIRTHENNLSTT